MIKVLPLLGLVLSAALGTSCTSSDEGGPCDLEGSGQVSFGDTKLDALIEASAKFDSSTDALAEQVRSACNAIATDLGASASEDTAMACSNAAGEITAVLEANVGAQLIVEYVAPVCAASGGAFFDCVGECDASFDATGKLPQCEGGELAGSCSGMCSGECTVEGSVACEGSCSGTCEGSCSASVVGSCSGTCEGTCEGTCSAMDAQGNCMGTCEGTCRGSCEGTIEGSCSGECEGMCEGSCRAEGMANCEGTCSGECSVDWVEPVCEGGTLDVDAEADCQVACQADASFDLECSDPELVVTVIGVASSADLEALVTTLQANYGKILKALFKVRLVVRAAADFGGQIGGATAAAASAGVEASQCLARAVTLAAEATASAQVSVSASVEVSGAVGADVQ